MEHLPEPVVSHASPYRATDFGKICYEIGLSPVTMNVFSHEINKLTKDLPNFTNSLKKSSISSRHLLERYFSLFALSSETRNQSLEKKPKNNSDIPKIVFDWLNGESLIKIKKKYFGNEENSYRNAVDFIQNFIIFYTPWLSLGINKLLKFKKSDLELPFFLTNLPNFLLAGTMNWNEMMLISFEICNRNQGSKEIANCIEEITSYSEDDLLNNFINSLSNISLEEIVIALKNYPQSLRNEIWDKILDWQKILNSSSIS